jgi:hypothetical protein
VGARSVPLGVVLIKTLVRVALFATSPGSSKITALKPRQRAREQHRTPHARRDTIILSPYQHRIGLYLMSYYCCSILSPYCPMFRMFRICRSHSDMYRDTRNILTIYTQYDGGKVVPKLGGNRYSFLSGAAPPLCGCFLPDPLSLEHATRRDGDRQLPSAFMLPARTMSPPIVASERTVTSQVQLGSSSCA